MSDFELLKGYEDRYIINREGCIIIITGPRKWNVIKATLSEKGYFRVTISKDGKKYKTQLLHRLLAIQFIPNPENKPCINHIDCNTQNNSIDNLEWCTHAENMAHAAANGRYNPIYGSSHHNAKLTEDDVRTIRRLRREGVMNKELAKMYCVDRTMITKITSNKHWSHVKDDISNQIDEE